MQGAARPQTVHAPLPPLPVPLLLLLLLPLSLVPHVVSGTNHHGYARWVPLVQHAQSPAPPNRILAPCPTILRARYPSSQSVREAAMKMAVTVAVAQGCCQYQAVEQVRKRNGRHEQASVQRMRAEAPCCSYSP